MVHLREIANKLTFGLVQHFSNAQERYAERERQLLSRMTPKEAEIYAEDKSLSLFVPRIGASVSRLDLKTIADRPTP